MKVRIFAVILTASILFGPFLMLPSFVEGLPEGPVPHTGYFTVEYPKGNSTFWITTRNLAEGGYDALTSYGSVCADLNPTNVNFGLRTYAVTSHFNIYNYYENGWHNWSTPSLDAEVLSVYAVIVAYHDLNQGWFSVRYDENQSWYDSTPWLASSQYYNTVGVGVTTGQWHNSSLFPYKGHVDGGSMSPWFTNTWDITNLMAWNVSMLQDCQYPVTSAGLNIMWTSIENTTYQLFDYVGIIWSGYGDYIGYEELPIVPEIGRAHV